MNSQKAKEYFSQYHENTLDAGIRQGFERALSEDAQLAAEYRAFVSVFNGLDVLREQEIAVPDDLHDRITARLDRMDWETSRKRSGSVFSWWKSLAIGGVAALAIVGTIASLRNSGDPGRASANLGGMISGGRPILAADGHRLAITVRGGTTETMTVQMGDKTLDPIHLTPSKPSAKIENPNRAAALVTIALADGKQRLLFALPGTAAKGALSGRGNLGSLACAIADLHRSPVEVSIADNNTQVSWKLDVSDALKCNVEGAQISIEQTASGIIKLSQP